MPKCFKLGSERLIIKDEAAYFFADAQALMRAVGVGIYDSVDPMQAISWRQFFL